MKLALSYEKVQRHLPVSSAHAYPDHVPIRYLLPIAVPAIDAKHLPCCIFPGFTTLAGPSAKPQSLWISHSTPLPRRLKQAPIGNCLTLPSTVRGLEEFLAAYAMRLDDLIRPNQPKPVIVLANSHRVPGSGTGEASADCRCDSIPAWAYKVFRGARRQREVPDGGVGDGLLVVEIAGKGCSRGIVGTGNRTGLVPVVEQNSAAGKLALGDRLQGIIEID